MLRQKVQTLFCRSWETWKFLTQASDVIGALFQRAHLEGSVKNRYLDEGPHQQCWGTWEEKLGRAHKDVSPDGLTK